MKLTIDIKPTELLELVDVLKSLAPQDKPKAKNPVAKSQPAEPDVSAIAQMLGVKPEELEVINLGNGLQGVKAQDAQPQRREYKDDDIIELSDGKGGTEKYRWGDIPKNSHGDVLCKWLDEHCHCGRTKHGTDADYEFDEEDAVGKDVMSERAARKARCDNPGGYM